MKFRTVLVVFWILGALGMAWYLRGGFGVRISHAYQRWLPVLGAWVLWVWAAILIVGVGFVAAYLLAKGLQAAAPQFVR
jgi:hypothetical protein